MPYLGTDFFARETITVARDLIGSILVVGHCEGRIVEVEAYTTDAASHAVIRRNQAASMRETYGQVYVYFTYGMYYCLNFTTERGGTGAVLIRAAEPLKGIEEMSGRRRTSKLKNLASGPGKLCQAFGINLDLNGKRIGKEIKLRARTTEPTVLSSVRIGISQATDLEWRFYERDNPFVSPHPKSIRSDAGGFRKSG
ncbi:MAG TPA: DNA-3-methyladenine glycosylase [Blastocatellia bacterium]|nr:DNA-3-methyladenine glycosylase [Blastocatellia bacterium]